ncbi:MAG: (d)CMP kinase [Desulfitobacteriaceae bacterium]
MQTFQLAIDGPAGAGKSTVAQAVARKLGIFYVDTGAMYRVIAYKALKEHINISDEKAISSMVEGTKIVLDHSEAQRIWCDDEDITLMIRSSEISRAVSVIATYPKVRERLVKLQRQEAERGGVVMDGRDIGTCVLPQADLKIFLTALPEERARRRWLELVVKDKSVTLEEVAREIQKRDRIDMERGISPLKPADDAIILDTTGLKIEEIVTRIVEFSNF